jgi:hypothetical protein
LKQFIFRKKKTLPNKTPNWNGPWVVLIQNSHPALPFIKNGQTLALLKNIIFLKIATSSTF